MLRAALPARQSPSRQPGPDRSTGIGVARSKGWLATMCVRLKPQCVSRVSYLSQSRRWTVPTKNPRGHPHGPGIAC